MGADTGGLDWFQTAISRPDHVVQDLISFITPSASPTGHVTHFFRNLAKGEGIEVCPRLLHIPFTHGRSATSLIYPLAATVHESPAMSLCNVADYYRLLVLAAAAATAVAGGCLPAELISGAFIV